jgi:hypothetical protein
MCENSLTLLSHAKAKGEDGAALELRIAVGASGDSEEIKELRREVKKMLLITVKPL